MPQTRTRERDPDRSAAIVRFVGRDGDRLMVAPPSGPADARPVRSALATEPAPGDELVVIDTPDGEVAIAVLAASGAPALALADGTSARVDHGGAVLDVLRADGTRLFRYESGAGAGRLTLEDQSIDVHATGGDLRLRAAGDVHIEGRAVHAVGTAPGAEAALRLSPREATLTARRVRLDGEDLDVAAARTTIESGEARAVLGRALLEVGRLESVAETVVQTARNLYQRVHELAQKRAGELRTIADDSIQVRAREVLTRAVEAYKIRSEKIHLG